MTESYTYSESTTFTVTHARYIASKVMADLKRMQRYHGAPGDDRIAKYDLELVALLRSGYLDEITYGFQKDGDWIEPTLRYTADDCFGGAQDHDPGRVSPWADTAGARFSSYLTYSSSWYGASEAVRGAFGQTLPFQRVAGEEPGARGSMVSDKTYSAGGRAVHRYALRSW